MVELRLVSQNEGFGKKGVFEINGACFRREDLRISLDINPPKDIKEEDIPRYEPVDRKHYVASEILYFQDRQWLKGCGENRPIPDAELDREIESGLELAFRWSYYEQWKNDPSRVRRLDDKVASD